MGLFIKKEILKFVWRVFVQGELFGGNCLGSKSPGAICGGEKGEKKVMGGYLFREDFMEEMVGGSYPWGNCH